MEKTNYKTVGLNDTIATRKCACGCGGTVEIKKCDVFPCRIRRDGGIKKFIYNHHTKTEEHRKIVSAAGKAKVKEVPDISPCVNRRFRGGNYYSRRLMEKHVGRNLSRNEIVHHINGDQTDDRIENLEIITRGEHTRLHSLKLIYDDDFAETLKDMYKSGLRQIDISKIYGVSQCAISNAMKRYDIKVAATCSRGKISRKNRSVKYFKIQREI